jgi:hypothetical protein
MMRFLTQDPRRTPAPPACCSVAKSLDRRGARNNCDKSEREGLLVAHDSRKQILTAPTRLGRWPIAAALPRSASAMLQDSTDPT